ncbi:hypothetical protein BN132_126 [Cronobacter turicensis 564]|nr:hypothetical protein BN132_126 [Cronobacter turicensis 564]
MPASSQNKFPNAFKKITVSFIRFKKIYFPQPFKARRYFLRCVISLLPATAGAFVTDARAINGATTCVLREILLRFI